MSRIAILPPAVADQIAAGEVVERPASIVKELVENALDAGATAVTVEIEEGGRALVRVRDDGQGMSADEAPLALQRHATSKIRTAHDLVGVHTFGFRGEALPAIASVARLVLETSTVDGEGTRVVVANGTRERIEPVARRRGTTVSVTELFHAVPARRKFLRSARGEWRAIADLLVTTALVRRDVHLAATHDGRVAFEAAPARSLRDRLAATWGVAAAAHMVDVDDVRGPVQVRGLVEKPEHVGGQARRVFLMVNGRAIRDAGIVRAAEAAYLSTIPAGTRPSLALELVLPGDMVDVNVHPAKAEVRFHDRWALERIVEEAVRRALGADAARPLADWRFGAERTWSPRLPAHPDTSVLTARPDPAPLFAPQPGPGEIAIADDDGHVPQGEAPAADGGVATPAVHLPTPLEVPPLVQLRRTWLMFERPDGIVLIDQHSAHERVLFERLMTRTTAGGSAVQVLLLPLTLHLSAAEADAFEEHREAFERLGFGIEGFGGQTLVVQAVPMPHVRFDAERCLRETLASLAGDRLAASATTHERLAMTVACKSAVKAGDALSPQEMRQLFLDLARTTLPAHDVHGRATIVQLGFDELERRFGRA